METWLESKVFGKKVGSQDVGGILEKLILRELSVAALQLLVKVFGGEIMLQFQFPQVECGPGGRVFSSFKPFFQ